MPLPHQVLHNVKSYMDSILCTSSIAQFDHVCNVLLDPTKEDISPLLLHYDNLDKFTDLKIPTETMLRLDQSFFREFLVKMRKAH